MSSTETSRFVPALGVHVRNEVGGELQATLVELLDLSLVGKQLHWSVVGPRFRSLHLELDALIDAWRELADTVAERAVAVGSWPDGQAHTVAAEGGSSPVDRGAILDERVVALIAGRLAEAGERIRGRMDRLGEIDAASQDVLVEVVRAIEMQLWMVRAQLPDVRGAAGA